MTQDVNDEHLVRLAQQGDREAFLALYNRYINRVYNRVKSRVPPQDVEDVTQDVFIAVIRSLERFEHRSRFSTWLYTIVNRKIADFYRKRQRHGDEQTVRLDSIAGTMASPANGYERIDERIAIQKALNALPGHYREVILMRFADGMTFAEIASERGQTLEAVKSLYRRAIQAMRSIMATDESQRESR